MPSCLLEPLWDQFAALLPMRDEYAPNHPLGRHRRRVADRVVFEHIVQALVHGSGYERISSPGCSDRTIRRRVKLWSQLGISEQVHALALEAYDRVIGLGLAEISVDGCITKAPSGGERAGRSPVDRDCVSSGWIRGAVFLPCGEVPVDGLPRGEVVGHIAPRNPGPVDIQDGVHDPAQVVLGWAPDVQALVSAPGLWPHHSRVDLPPKETPNTTRGTKRSCESAIADEAAVGLRQQCESLT